MPFPPRPLLVASGPTGDLGGFLLFLCCYCWFVRQTYIPQAGLRLAMHVVKDDCELVILLPPLPKYWDNWQVSQTPSLWVARDKHSNLLLRNTQPTELHSQS